nr:MAG TPA: hypothetical protein [Caudoviricetes sp.]
MIKKAFYISFDKESKKYFKSILSAIGKARAIY